MDRRNPFHHQDHQLYHLIQQQQQLPLPPQSTTAAMDTGGGGGERIPQWSTEETKELLGIREELDQTFMETKRNKLLWEVVAAKMADKGFARSAEQCKSKWKNLVTRYKACETSEPEAIRQQFPFYSEIQSIFTARMQRELWSEPTEGSTCSKRKHHQFSSDEEEEEEVEEPNQDINEELLSFIETDKKEAEAITTATTCTDPRKRVKKGKGINRGSTSTLKETLEDFMRQTVKMDKEWRGAWEMKEREREKRENEWRKRMADLEEERAAAERRLMEREDERRLREEARAQKRDTLIDALLNKLINRNHNDVHYQGF
ncbi:hypothetical protein N665_0496s0030 [Sinapis alba]|nr:hypothetical protein N665_0496s0030 [Sinapis alba]